MFKFLKSKKKEEENQEEELEESEVEKEETNQKDSNLSSKIAFLVSPINFFIKYKL